jgi:anti-sigma regulatory factor (Ser/Thr protein kinase)
MTTTYQHEALMYAGADDFVTTTAPMIRSAILDEQPVFVMIRAERIEWLRAELGDQAAEVSFADMGEIGRNPGRIIPVWREFMAAHTGANRQLFGIGEPIWADRGPDELLECQSHEALLNTAVDPTANFRLVCPYDTTQLDEAILAEARRSHPIVVQNGTTELSDTYTGPIASFGPPLAEPTAPVSSVAFADGDLDAVRRFVATHAIDAGLTAYRTTDLQLAVNEVAANSLRHGGGRGTLRLWEDTGAFVCEVSDAGRITSPLIGREQPAHDLEGGRGLWIAHHLCDLVQIRSSDAGTVIRMHVQTR